MEEKKRSKRGFARLKLCFVKSEAICRGGEGRGFTLNGANRTTRGPAALARASSPLLSFECEMSRGERAKINLARTRQVSLSLSLFTLTSVRFTTHDSTD